MQAIGHGRPTRSLKSILRKSSRSFWVFNIFSRVSLLHSFTHGIILIALSLLIFFSPVVDGSVAADEAFSLRLEDGRLPGNFTRPINNLKRDADRYLGNVYSSLETNIAGRFISVDPITNPLVDRTDNTFLFVCFNDVKTEDAKKACFNVNQSSRVFAATSTSYMALCPGFFPTVDTGGEIPQPTVDDKEFEYKILKAIKESIEVDEKAYRDASSRSKKYFPSPTNPSE